MWVVAHQTCMYMIHGRREPGAVSPPCVMDSCWHLHMPKPVTYQVRAKLHAADDAYACKRVKTKDFCNHAKHRHTTHPCLLVLLVMLLYAEKDITYEKQHQNTITRHSSSTWLMYMFQGLITGCIFLQYPWVSVGHVGTCTLEDSSPRKVW